MTWWQNWRHALAHPADNVVAAMVVLAGVAITAVVTLFVSAASRRHERLRENRSHVIQNRADTYLEAGIFLFRTEQQKDPKGEISTEEIEAMYPLATKLTIYGTQKAANRFYLAALSVMELRILELEDADQEAIEKAKTKANDLRADFNYTFRADVQGLRTRPLWLRWIIRRGKRQAKKIQAKIQKKPEPKEL